jgi:hypothetical protein
VDRPLLSGSLSVSRGLGSGLRAVRPGLRVATAVVLATLAFAVVALLGEPQAHAAEQTPVRVVLVFERTQDQLLTRIEAEVAAAGFVVVASRESSPLEELARALDAAAAIRVLPSRTGVEVWMADATSGRSLLRQVIVDERPGGPDEGLIALQTAELLRTSLLSRPAEVAPAQEQLGPARTTIDPGPADEPRGSVDSVQAVLQAGVGPLYSPGGTGAALQLCVSLQRSVSEHWGLGLDLSAPLVGGELSGPEGSTRVGLYSAGFALFIATAPSSAVFASAGLGVAVASLRFEGQAVSPLQGESVGVWTGAGVARTELGVTPARWLRVGVTGVAGATFDRVLVDFAGSEAGEWGPGFVAAFLFAGVPWY